MDGFNTIPIQNSGYNSAPTEPKNTSPNNISIPKQEEFGIEINDDTVKKEVKPESSLFLVLSVLVMFGMLGYFGYLYFSRIMMLQEISRLGTDFQTLSQNINKEEIVEFIELDKSLNAINQKLGKHVLISNVLDFVNKNIRNTMQVSDYRIGLKDNEVEVTLLNIAPSFKELAEQSEKMFELRNNGEIKSFNVTQLSLESDGRKVRFALNIIFDKKKVSAVAPQNQNPPITNN